MQSSDPITILHGDCLARLRELPDNSIDAVVTDPPYHLTSIVKRFGKTSQTDANKTGERARSGADGMARLARGFMGKIWDGGDIAFQPETWVAVQRVLKPGGHLVAFGGSRTYHRLACAIEDSGFEIRDQILWIYGSGFPKSHNQEGEWDGWGTALKPAHEPSVLARKPLIGTVLENLEAHGVGAINIDDCLVGEAPGRWPANVIHDGSDEVLEVFPAAPGQQGPVSGTAPSEKTSNVYGRMRREGEASADSENAGKVGFKMKPGMRRFDSGSAARFFYCAKASKADRGPGNNHPTVKPTELMRYLCRLVTPPGGLILDPFAGSGSTGKAAKLEGFRFIGIERDAEYVAIARKRLGLSSMLQLEDLVA